MRKWDERKHTMQTVSILIKRYRFYKVQRNMGVIISIDGRFAETAIVNYRLSFADLEEQTSVFRFRLKQTIGSLLFLFSICRKQTKVVIFRLQILATWRHGHGDVEMRRYGDMET